MKNNLDFQLLEEIFFNEKHSVEELADELHSSVSSVYRSIDNLNGYFSLYNCTIERNPCRIVGDETYIRNYYKTYFKEAYTPYEWPFKSFNEEDVDNNIRKVTSLLFKNNPTEENVIDFAFYRSIKLMILVNITRYHHNHRVTTENVQSFILKVLLKVTKNFTFPKYFQTLSNQPYTIDYIYQIFYPYITKDMAINPDSLKKVRARNHQVDTAIGRLEHSLCKLAKQLSITLKTDDLMVALYGTTVLEEHDANSMHIFYNRNLLFNKRIHQQFPVTYAKLYNMARQFRLDLSLKDHEEKLHYLVYTLFTNWENLLSDLYTHYRQPKILVLSDANYAHAALLKNLLLMKLPDNTIIENYQETELTTNNLEALDHDVIVSSFKLPKLKDKEVIVIGHYLTSNDIYRIKKRLRKINQRISITL